MKTVSKEKDSETLIHIIDFFIYMWGGKRSSVHVKISHGIKEYGDKLLSKVSKQIGIRKNELCDLIECPLTHEALIKILTERNRLG